MRRVLIVCPRFAPINAPDMHRVRQSVPYLAANGWEGVVLAVQPNGDDFYVDDLLMMTVPSELEVHRLPISSGRFTRRLRLRDIGLRAMRPVAAAGSTLLSGGSFDLVWFSTTAFPLLILGPYWKARYGVPYIVDLQDPWVSDYYKEHAALAPPGGRVKYAATQLLARVLEPKVMRGVSHVITVSPAYPIDLCARYSWMREEQFSVLPFGASMTDFELLGTNPVVQSMFDPLDGKQHWVYAGAIGPMMEFSLRALFMALRRAVEKAPAQFGAVRLHFIGTSYAKCTTRSVLLPVAEECGVAGFVTEHPQRLPYFEALQCLLDADALIVPGSDDPGYTASKIYPLILARKPLLAIFHTDSSVVEVLQRTGAGTVVTFPHGDTTERLSQAISVAWFESAAREPPRTDWLAFEAYTSREMTRRECNIFDQVVVRAV